MAPLILSKEFRVFPSQVPRTSEVSAWIYDGILEGLVSGKISGRPMESQDAYLLLMLLEGLNWPPDANKLAGAIPYFANHMDIGTLRTLMHNLGYNCRLKKVRGSNLPRNKVVGLILGPDDRLWAIDTSNSAKLTRMRPAVQGIGADRRHMIDDRYYNYLDFAPEIAGFGSVRPTARESFSVATCLRFAPDLRLTLVLTLFSGALTVAFSIMVIFLFDLIVTGQQAQVIFSVLIAAGALFLCDLGFRAIKARLLGRISGRFEYILGCGLLGKLLKMPSRMIDQAPISEQTQRLRELEGVRDFFAGPFAIVLMELPVTIILVCAIAYFSPPLALLIISVTVVFFVAGLCFVPTLGSRAAKLSQAKSRLTQLKIELIDKRHIISRNGLAWPWAEKAERAVEHVVVNRYKLARASSALEAICYLFVPLAATSVIFVGAVQAVAGVLSPGELVAVTMLTWRAVAPVQQALLLLPNTRDMLRVFRQIDAMMLFAEVDQVPDIMRSTHKAEKLSASNIFMRGPNSDVPTLAGASMEIPAGLFITMTGPSGCGKSLLLGVLSGQVRPQAGSVRLGAVGLTELSSEYLGQRIVHIPQRPLFIYGSLAQNLRVVDPLLSDEQIKVALKEVGLGKLILRLPEGIHTRIDPAVDTTVLTGGVRTAVAVAQALLVRPAVLLLDESSEDIAPAIDTAIVAALKKRRGQMTSLVATYRPSVIAASDGVIQIAAGRTDLTFNTQERDQAV